MALKLKTLLEGYAWDRKADGSLPTLRDAIATHAANIAETEYKYAGRKVTIDKNGTEDQTKWKVKFIDSNKTVPYVDAVANITPRPKMNEPRWQDSDGDGKWYEPGQDVKEIAEGHNDHGVLDLVSAAEDKLQRLRSNMATNSVLQREEKMGYLRAFDELLDLLSEIGFQSEME